MLSTDATADASCHRDSAQEVAAATLSVDGAQASTRRESQLVIAALPVFVAPHVLLRSLALSIAGDPVRIVNHRPHSDGAQSDGTAQLFVLVEANERQERPHLSTFMPLNNLGGPNLSQNTMEPSACLLACLDRTFVAQSGQCPIPGSRCRGKPRTRQGWT
jgi:hypothetical protein